MEKMRDYPIHSYVSKLDNFSNFGAKSWRNMAILAAAMKAIADILVKILLLRL